MTAANRHPVRQTRTTTAAQTVVNHDYVVPTGRLWEITLLIAELGTANSANGVHILHDVNQIDATSDSDTATSLTDAAVSFGSDQEWAGGMMIYDDGVGAEYAIITSHTDTVLTGTWVPAGDPANHGGGYTTWKMLFDEFLSFTYATFDPRSLYGRPLILEAGDVLRFHFDRLGASSTCASTLYANERNI